MLRKTKSADLPYQLVDLNFQWVISEETKICRKKRVVFIVKKMSGAEQDPLEDPPPSTQQSNPSHRKYEAVFLFHYDLDDEKPFSSVSLDKFEGTDFPFNLISGHLALGDRLKPRHLSRLSGAKYCIFAKCEEGNKKKPV